MQVEIGNPNIVAALSIAYATLSVPLSAWLAFMGGNNRARPVVAGLLGGIALAATAFLAKLALGA